MILEFVNVLPGAITVLAFPTAFKMHSSGSAFSIVILSESIYCPFKVFFIRYK